VRKDKLCVSKTNKSTGLQPVENDGEGSRPCHQGGGTKKGVKLEVKTNEEEVHNGGKRKKVKQANTVGEKTGLQECFN